MKQFRNILFNLSFSINLLVVLLAAFRAEMILPNWLQFAGRFHPVILHFPIVLIILLPGFYFWLLRHRENQALKELFITGLHLNAFFAGLSALLGLFLSGEGGYDLTQLNLHLWMGVTISLFSFILLVVFLNQPRRQMTATVMLAVLCLTMIFGSHIGGTLTHGEGYLNSPFSEDQTVHKRVITDSSPVFEAAIVPILESRCYGCHNENKAKGRLVMTRLEKLLKGGKSGPIWVAGDPVNSHIIQRLELPLEEKKHMPPQGKPQLSIDEITLIRSWIRSGASLDKPARDYNPADSISFLAKQVIAMNVEIVADTTHYNFSPASPELIKKLSNPYRVVAPLAMESPALHVQFFLKGNYRPGMLTELDPIRNQIVSMNLTNMPVKDEELAGFAKFINLRHLVLNGTSVTGKTFPDLQKCAFLQTLAIANTPVKKENLSSLLSLPSLRKVFVWNTEVDEKWIQEISAKNKNIHWETGYLPDPSEKLPLPPVMASQPGGSIITPGTLISLRHPMSGVTIRYTIDGADPDSIQSPVYEKPVVITGMTTLKSRATREGWYASPVSSFVYFTKGIKADDILLNNTPDPKYLDKGSSTLADLQKGVTSNLTQGWLGFREKPLDAIFRFEKPVQISSITFCVAQVLPAFVFPPERIEIHAGMDDTHLKLIGRYKPSQPGKYLPDEILGLNVPVKDGKYSHYRILAFPVNQLPAWHKNKGSKGWLFVDEILFNKAE